MADDNVDEKTIEDQIRAAADELLVKGSGTARELVNGYLPDADVFDGIGDGLYGAITQQILATLDYAKSSQQRVGELMMASSTRFQGLSPTSVECVAGEPLMLTTELRNRGDFGVPLALPNTLALRLEKLGAVRAIEARVVDANALYLSPFGNKISFATLFERASDHLGPWKNVGEKMQRLRDQGWQPLDVGDAARVAIELTLDEPGIYRVHLQDGLVGRGEHLAVLTISPLFVDAVVREPAS